MQKDYVTLQKTYLMPQKLRVSQLKVNKQYFRLNDMIANVLADNKKLKKKVTNKEK